MKLCAITSIARSGEYEVLYSSMKTSILTNHVTLICFQREYELLSVRMSYSCEESDLELNVQSVVVFSFPENE